MGWPQSRFKSFAPGVGIASDDLNQMQDGTVGIVDGTYTLASVTVDGAGGGTGSAPAGSVKVSASAVGGTLPTTAISLAALYKEIIPIGWAYVTWDGISSYTFIKGVNIASVTRNSAGRITIALVTPAPNLVLGIATGQGNSAAALAQVEPASASSVQVQINNSNTLAALDTSFFVLLFGY